MTGKSGAACKLMSAMLRRGGARLKDFSACFRALGSRKCPKPFRRNHSPLYQKSRSLSTASTISFIIFLVSRIAVVAWLL